ncbi:MAG: response regulator transcription factor [Myxococcales bacterium]|nr:response regulator transcription factor [Myxococcales bacterium]
MDFSAITSAASSSLKPSSRLTGRRVLVVEDEPDLRELLTYNLQTAGYEVRAAESGELGLELYESFEPHVILLDLMLTDLQGTEVCRRIRAQKREVQPAIIMLTAKGDEIDRVVGFEVGADDYVVKPFSMRELLLRVNAMFRGARLPTGSHPSVDGSLPAPVLGQGQGNEEGRVRRKLVVGTLEVDVDGHHAFVEGVEIHVSILEMRLLIYLMESRGRVRSREELLSDVWGYKPGVSTRTVDTHVKRLRDKLASAGKLIETVRGMGYRFAEVPRTETM